MARIIRMTQCKDVEPFFTAYLDDEAAPSDRETVERHRRLCAACDTRLREEGAAREAVRRHAGSLRAVQAPPALVSRVGEIASRPSRGAAWPLLVRVAAAAIVVVVLGGWWLGVATRASTVVLAAQLTADHKKCFFTLRDVGTLQPRQVAAYLSSRYGFTVQVPENSTALGLRLVGARRCLSGEGTNAHLLYTWQGESVSLYVLPSDARQAASLELLGHDTEVWTGHNGSYALVTRASGRSLAELVTYMQHATR